MRNRNVVVVFALILCGTAAFAQSRPMQPPASPGRPSQAARQSAWDELSPVEQKKVQAEFLKRIGPIVRARLKDRVDALRSVKAPAAAPVFGQMIKYNPNAGSISSEPGVFVNAAGQVVDSRGIPLLGAANTPGAPLPTQLQPLSGATAMTGSDADGDGLSDDFESQLAAGFVPVYHAGERAGTGFADFGDWVPQQVIQTFPPTPVLSKYRVRPLGFSTDPATGQQYGFVQIDYLTLWNRDDGLELGTFCEANLDFLLGLVGVGVTQFLDGAKNHKLDNEWSSVLAYAPTAVPFAYADDPSGYLAASYRLAAHEGTPMDKSMYAFFSPGVPINNHLNVALSRSKHGTYSFSPDYLPLIPDGIIFAVNFAIDDLYFTGVIEYDYYLYFLYLSDVTFYSCVVEHFTEQGGGYPGTFTNVGELSQPINGSHYILDPDPEMGLLPKLNQSLWILQ